jgi:hypothetical protein
MGKRQWWVAQRGAQHATPGPVTGGDQDEGMRLLR